MEDNKIPLISLLQLIRGIYYHNTRAVLSFIFHSSGFRFLVVALLQFHLIQSGTQDL